jgi:hypothetical protein
MNDLPDWDAVPEDYDKTHWFHWILDTDNKERKRVCKLYVNNLHVRFRNGRIGLERYRDLAQKIHKELDIDFRMIPL